MSLTGIASTLVLLPNQIGPALSMTTFLEGSTCCWPRRDRAFGGASKPEFGEPARLPSKPP